MATRDPGQTAPAAAATVPAAESKEAKAKAEEKLPTFTALQPFQLGGFGSVGVGEMPADAVKTIYQEPDTLRSMIAAGWIADPDAKEASKPAA